MFSVKHTVRLQTTKEMRRTPGQVVEAKVPLQSGRATPATGAPRSIQPVETSTSSTQNASRTGATSNVAPKRSTLRVYSGPVPECLRTTRPEKLQIEVPV